MLVQPRHAVPHSLSPAVFRHKGLVTKQLNIKDVSESPTWVFSHHIQMNHLPDAESLSPVSKGSKAQCVGAGRLR